MSINNLFFLIAALLMATSSVAANATLPAIIEVNAAQSLLTTSEFVLDPNGALDTKQLLEGQYNWSPLSQKPSGYTSDAYWVRSPISNLSDDFQSATVIFRNPFVTKFKVFLLHVDSNRLEEISPKSGSLNRRIEFLLSPKESVVVFIKTNFLFQSNVPLRLYGQDVIQEADMIESMIVFMALGVLFGLIVYNFFVFLSLREPSHFAYLIYAVSSFLVVALQSGYGNIFLGHTWPWINNIVNTTATIGGLVFVRVFLNTKQCAPLLDRFMWFFQFVGVAYGIIFYFVPEPELCVVFDVYIGISSICVVTSGIISYRSGYSPAKYYLIAWAGLCSSIWYWVGANYGFFSDGYYAPFALILGMTFEMNFISFALSERVNMLRKDLIFALKFQNEKLEQRVKEESLIIKRQQESLINSAKMAALVRMASGIAHEINNPLTIIAGHAALLKSYISLRDTRPDKFRSSLITIENTTQRIAQTTSGLLSFVDGDDEEELSIVDLCALVNDTLQYFVEVFRLAEIEVTTEFNGSAHAHCRKKQIGHIILELLNNAHDAVSSLPEKWIKIEVVAKEDVVEVRLVDSGLGIQTDIAKNIFDPFFTTKAVGKGVGLGLSRSEGILKEQGGSLRLDKSRKNTCFVMTLMSANRAPA